MNVQQILREKGGRIVHVTPLTTVAETAQLLERERIGAVLVRDASNDVAGLISERDLVRGIARNGAAALAMPVSELMTRDVIYCGPRDTIDAVMQLMTTRRFRHLPVLDEGTLVGIISIGDVVKHRIAETEMEAQALKAYIATG